jgi:hypothetical protein
VIPLVSPPGKLGLPTCTALEISISRLDRAEEIIQDPKDRSTEIIQIKKQTIKRSQKSI